MPIRRSSPPWDYLHSASVPSLESYEMSRLNHAANLRREVSALIEQWIEDTAQALLARWVRQDRVVTQPAPCLPEEAAQSELPFAEPLPAEASRRRATHSVKFPGGRSRTGTHG
jgi:hypothetical protein